MTIPIHFLSLTLPNLAANVALDEALLEAAEADELPGPTLRLWESDDYGVVLGRGSRAETEVNWIECLRRQIPVVRRSSGGGAVVAGPGCLMYALVIPQQDVSPSQPPHPLLPARDQRCDVTRLHLHVLDRMASSFAARGLNVRQAGTSDLAWATRNGDVLRKVSGNSLRLKRRWFLYHGTFLYGFDVGLASRLLGAPPRPPAYRQSRTHEQFIANLPLDRFTLEELLKAAWNARARLDDWPRNRASAIENCMHRAALGEQLQRYRCRYPEEPQVVERIHALVDNHPDCFVRTCRPGHVTGSAWIVSEDRSRFLLVHHRKLNRWLQPGGHADGDPDVAGVALREAREESGLTRLRVVDALLSSSAPTPLDLDVHVIPARYDVDGRVVEDAHEHHDVRYLVVGSDSEMPRVSAESHDVRWFTAQEVAEIAPEASVLRMLRKSLDAKC